MDRPEDYQIAFLIALGSATILSLVVAIIVFVIFYHHRILQTQLAQERLVAEYQQKMLQAALESQENERKRLAADLHDGIGAMLSTIRLSLSTQAQQEGLKNSVTHVKSMLDDTIESVRKLSRDLLPSTLEKFGLNVALREMCEQYATVSGLPVFWQETGAPEPLDKTHEVMIFRIVQELINNAMKHAQATTIHVTTQWNGNLEVTVTDDGIGFTPSINTSGLGLFNMQNRARLLDGSLIFGANNPKGTRVVLLLPGNA